MKIAGRFPIPEPLLHQPPKYWLYIDSIMQSMWDLNQLKEHAEVNITPNAAPANSCASDDDLSMGQSSSSEGPVVAKKDSEEEVDSDNNLKEKKKALDKSILITQGFNMSALGLYPHKSREGEIPKRLLLVPDMENIINLSELYENQ